MVENRRAAPFAETAKGWNWSRAVRNGSANLVVMVTSGPIGQGVLPERPLGARVIAGHCRAGQGRRVREIRGRPAGSLFVGCARGFNKRLIGTFVTICRDGPLTIEESMGYVNFGTIGAKDYSSQLPAGRDCSTPS